MMVNIYVTTSSTWHLIMSIHITNWYLFSGVRTALSHEGTGTVQVIAPV